jgi:hypothetical protein
MGFDVDRICSQAQVALAEVNRLGKGRVDQLDLALAPHYAFDESAIPAEARRWGAWGFDREGHPVELEIAVVE